MFVSNFLILLSVLTVSLIPNSSADYIGAVVEHNIYQGTDDESSQSKLSKNLDLYEELISLSAEHNVQVLVFPEFGLTPGPMKIRSDLYPYIEVIPEVSENIIPCNNTLFSDRPILQRMSCSAIYNQQLILINMIDNVTCSINNDNNCPSDQHYQYNTDVIFDKTGQIVAKYHKSHEVKSLQSAYNVPLEPSHITYKTDFNVEFGLFTCFDIMWYDPPKILIKNNIQHFLYAVDMHEIGDKTIIQSWSQNNNATMLSANLGAGKYDCSDILVNGKSLSSKKYYINNNNFPDENILVSIIPSL